eukprot:EG_transcript_15075
MLRLAPLRCAAAPGVLWCAAHRYASSGAAPAGPKPRIGFLGMGIMGTAMSINLVKAGYDVTVWNRNVDRCAPVQQIGAKVGSSPKAVVEGADITFGMLSDPAAAVAVALGPSGVVEGLAPGKGYVDVSTVDAETSQRIGAAVRAKGGAFLEAPVSGSKGPAEQGTLIFLTGGDEALFQQAGPALDVMGKAKFYLGGDGKGAHMKLVVNMVMGTMMAAFAEGLQLAEQSGLKQKDLLEVIGLGAISSPMFTLKGPAMAERRYPTAFPLKHQQKDLRLAIQLGEVVSQSTPVAAAANEVYKAAKMDGFGDADFSAVLEALIAAKK